MLQIKTVHTRKDWKDFIDLPWQIYQHEPNWVPPLKIAVRDLLNVNQNPFFRHAVMHPILVYRDAQCVGRAVGVIDDNYNRLHHENMAFFGFFETIHDQTVANTLLDEIAHWARSRGMKTLRGPVNPSMNHECGLLVEGFNDPPQVMMTYNPQYYPELIENWGMLKAKDLYAYQLVKGKANFSDRLIAQAERLRVRGSVHVRSVKMSEFSKEIESILEIYNDAWEKNWGFVPWEADEFRHMAKELKMIIDPELCLIAEVRGEPVGFALILPDVNQALKKIKNGKLFPFGIFKLFWNLKGPGKRATLDRCRIVTLGIKRNYREYGIGPIFYTECLKRGPALGYPTGEASWVLEDNRPMNKALELMGGKRYKVYRIYDRNLS